jgi:hypothetical protein
VVNQGALVVVLGLLSAARLELEPFSGREHAGEIPNVVRDLKSGERGRTRTCDPCLKRALLYQLSYAPTMELTDTNKNNVPAVPHW